MGRKKNVKNIRLYNQAKAIIASGVILCSGIVGMVKFSNDKDNADKIDFSEYTTSTNYDTYSEENGQFIYNFRENFMEYDSVATYIDKFLFTSYNEQDSFYGSFSYIMDLMNTLNVTENVNFFGIIPEKIIKEYQFIENDNLYDVADKFNMSIDDILSDFKRDFPFRDKNDVRIGEVIKLSLDPRNANENYPSSQYSEVVKLLNGRSIDKLNSSEMSKLYTYRLLAENALRRFDVKNIVDAGLGITKMYFYSGNDHDFEEIQVDNIINNVGVMKSEHSTLWFLYGDKTYSCDTDSFVYKFYVAYENLNNKILNGDVITIDDYDAYLRTFYELYMSKDYQIYECGSKIVR